MSYTVKEILYTLQGEGANAGRPAVFCRFAECNLWSGREVDRDGAVCRLCDTDFVGTDGPRGGRYDAAEQVTSAVAAAWPSSRQNLTAECGTGLLRAPSSRVPPVDHCGTGVPPVYSARPLRPFVVCTGGEPLLQVDTLLVESLHEAGFEVAVETNGTIAVPPVVDWICVSPKAGTRLAQDFGHELKLVFPQAGAEPPLYEGLDFQHFFLQPIDGPDLAANTQAALQYCLANPRWRLSLQLQKLLGIP